MLRIPLDWEPYRRRHWTGEVGDRGNGAFVFPSRAMVVVASNGGGWEHASVSVKGRTPTWAEMEWVKGKLWGDDVVMQLHVPKADHVNFHTHCLHMWRPIEGEIPRPPGIMVGPRDEAELEAVLRGEAQV